MEVLCAGRNLLFLPCCVGGMRRRRFGGAIQRGTARDGNFDRVLRHHSYIFSFLAGDIVWQLQQTGPGRSSIAMRKASRTMVGMLLVLTICSESFVSGFKALTTSTIWNFA